jgi:hypothetical protein
MLQACNHATCSSHYVEKVEAVMHVFQPSSLLWWSAVALSGPLTLAVVSPTNKASVSCGNAFSWDFYSGTVQWPFYRCRLLVCLFGCFQFVFSLQYWWQMSGLLVFFSAVIVFWQLLVFLFDLFCGFEFCFALFAPCANMVWIIIFTVQKIILLNLSFGLTRKICMMMIWSVRIGLTMFILCSPEM